MQEQADRNAQSVNFQRQLAAQASQESAQAAMAAAQAALAQARAQFVPDDPWRVIAGHTNYARGTEWFQFVGKVVQVTPDGILDTGQIGEPLGDTILRADRYETMDFFVRHFPHNVVDDDTISAADRYTGRFAENFTFTTVLGALRTVRSLDYGTLCDALPLTPEQLAARQKAVDAINAKKAAADAKVMMGELHAADQGMGYGLIRMGERYRDGRGVPKDLAKARDYLAKAVAAGEASAQRELDALAQ